MSKQGGAEKDQPTEQPPTSKPELSKGRVSHRSTKESPHSSRAGKKESRLQLEPHGKPLMKRGATPGEQLSPADKSSKPGGVSGGPARPQHRLAPSKPLLSGEITATSTDKKSSQIRQQEHRDLSELSPGSGVEKPVQPIAHKDHPTELRLPSGSPKDFKQLARRETRLALHGTSGQHSPASQESRAVSRQPPDTTPPRRMPPSVSQKKTAMAATSEASEKRSGVSSRDTLAPLPEKTKQHPPTGQPSDGAHTSSKKPVAMSQARASRITASSKSHLSSESVAGGAPIPVLGPKYVKQPCSGPAVKRVYSSSRSDPHDAAKRMDSTDQELPSKPLASSVVKPSTDSNKSKNSVTLHKRSQITVATQKECKEPDSDTVKHENPPPKSPTPAVCASHTDEHCVEEATHPRQTSVSMVDIQWSSNPSSFPFAGFDSEEKPASNKRAAAVTVALTQERQATAIIVEN